MALPIIDKSVSMTEASNNVENYIKDLEPMELLFKKDLLKKYIKLSCEVPREGYLYYIMKMHV